MSRRSKILTVSLVAGVAFAVIFHQRVALAKDVLSARIQKRTVADRLREFGDAARGRMKADFVKAGVSYPPSRVILLVLKQERRMEVYAAAGGTNRYVRAYPILAASGGPGPKMREGDRQVPEGIYPIELLNPNSSYHVSLRVGYPNEFDRAQAKKEGRTKLGGDIMIHGKALSVGCVALGDPAAEEIFTLAADVGIQNVTVISGPLDFRRASPPSPTNHPAWVNDLYVQIKARMAALASPERTK
jgi:hypothetical protein